MQKNLRSAWNSRQYMVSRDFEIFYYRDSHFKTGRSHSHSYYEFYLFLEGDVTMRIGTGEHRLSTGDLIVIPPDVPHHIIVHSDAPYGRFVFWITKEYCLQLMRQSADYGWIMQKAATEHHYVWHTDEVSFHLIQSRLIEALREIHSDSFGRNAAITLAVNGLVLQLNRTVYEQENLHYEANSTDIGEDIMRYIESHLNENLSLQELADKFFVSRFYISHYFSDSFGISLHQYIIKRRLAACRNELLKHRSITDVYAYYGFRDYSSFYRAFKKEYHLSPKEYQDVYAQDPMQSAS